jgi:predicted RNA methylase
MRFIISVVIPVLIGAAVGVGIGILSVFIAEIAGGVIARIRGRRATEYVEVDVKGNDCDDYCAMEGDELPQYVELPQAPAYIEEKR